MLKIKDYLVLKDIETYLENKKDELVPIILSLIQESYKAGLCQTEFDNTMNLIEENQELKSQLAGTTHCFDEEEHEKLKKQLEEYKATNKILSHELTKDKVLQQDCLTTCCGIPIGDIPKLITQQKEFIEWLEAMLKMYKNEYKDIDIAGHYNCVLAKYKEIIGENKDE